MLTELCVARSSIHRTDPSNEDMQLPARQQRYPPTLATTRLVLCPYRCVLQCSLTTSDLQPISLSVCCWRLLHWTSSARLLSWGFHSHHCWGAVLVHCITNMACPPSQCVVFCVVDNPLVCTLKTDWFTRHLAPCVCVYGREMGVEGRLLCFTVASSYFQLYNQMSGVELLQFGCSRGTGASASALCVKVLCSICHMCGLGNCVVLWWG